MYREGFETVLFLQNLRASAGTGAVILGVGAGLVATAVVGLTTFALERKLPYRKMLIATGVLIGVVLAIMVGTTVHTMQGLGWISTSPTPFDLSLGWGRWLGLYPTGRASSPSSPRSWSSTAPTRSRARCRSTARDARFPDPRLCRSREARRDKHTLNRLAGYRPRGL